LQSITTVWGTCHRMRPPNDPNGGVADLHDPAAYMLGYSWGVLRQLDRLQQRSPFDLINFPEYGAEGLAYQVNRKTFNWTPVIVHLHAPLALLTHRIGWPTPDSEFYRVASFMEGESIRLADGLMASSANIADFTSAFYGVPREAIDVVHCGIDCEVFAPPEPGSRESRPPTVLFIGNISAAKGVVTVCDAVLKLRSKYPDIRLLIVGQGDDDMTGSLRARAAAAGAGACLEIRPPVTDRSRLPELYQQAHVMASPSNHEGGVANVYIEAMACGCPVVACNTGGAPEAVTDGENGLLVPPKNVEATAAALDRILDDASFRQQLGAGGRRRAESYFALEKYIDRVLRAYEKAIERSREALKLAQARE
jgi:glycosyltransferase involved in cell wall biosynthesis